MAEQLTSDRWCILRTSGGRTLRLSQSLQASGFEVWTPTHIVKRRAHRRGNATVEHEAALLPTFVFARADRLTDLVALLRAPSHPHPAFSIFRYYGKAPLLADREVERLRVAERRAIPVRRRRTLAVGTELRIDGGAYTGMTGIVKQSDGRFTLIGFGGWMNVKIETFTLLTDIVDGTKPASGIAA